MYDYLAKTVLLGPSGAGKFVYTAYQPYHSLTFTAQIMPPPPFCS